VSELNGLGVPNALKFQQECRLKIGNLETGLAQYTTLMERNREAIDRLFGNLEITDDWIANMKLVPTQEQLHAIQRAYEEIEESLCGAH
jgi:hypothetical protein